MYEKLDDVMLKSGEQVELGLVKGPDLEWVNRIEGDLLAHKGQPWRWGNRIMLEQDLGVDAFFYVLHRDGEPFSNVMTIEYDGIGILGHVFTKPEDRRQGAASAIFQELMAHFEARKGQAMILGTGYDSPPYHIYKSFGFEGLEPQSGTMAFYSAGEEGFREAYFTAGEVVVERLEATHYPVVPILFSGTFKEVVRSVVMRLFGRSSSEGPLISLFRDELDRRANDKPTRTVIARINGRSTVVGFATTDRDPLWPGTCMVDVFCHPNFWAHGIELLNEMSWPDARRYVAYCDAGWQEKEDVLRKAGFQQAAKFERWMPVDRAVTDWVDVNMWVKG